MQSPEESGQGERETQREVTGQGRPSSLKMAQSAEGRKGKEKREIIVVVRSPCQQNDGVGEPSMDSECASGCTLVNGRRNSSPLGQPRSSQTGQVIQGLG